MDQVNILQEQLKNIKRRINSPKTDLLETEKTFIVRLELAYRDIKWNLQDNQFLFVKTDKQIDFKIENIKVVYNEAKYGIQSRRVKLPSKVLPDPIRNEYSDGILILEFVKIPEQ